MLAEARSRQRAHLVDEPLLPHPVDALLRCAHRARRAGCRGRRGPTGSTSVGSGSARDERLARDLDDLQRAHDAAAVGRQDRLGGRRVHLGAGAHAVARARPSASSASSRARTSGSVPGKRRSSSTADTYRPLPPTTIGTAAARADPVDRPPAPAPGTPPRVTACDGSHTSTRWCGTPPRSAGVGVAVPMSIPRYTCIESVPTISAGRPTRLRDLHGQRRLAGRCRPDDGEERASRAHGRQAEHDARAWRTVPSLPGRLGRVARRGCGAPRARGRRRDGAVRRR